MTPITDFAAFDDTQLIVMLHTGRPDMLRGIAQLWGVSSVSLHERADEMAASLKTAHADWSGNAGDQYQIALTSLIEAVRAVAELTGLMRDLIYSVSDWLAQAQAALPLPPQFGVSA
jgi:uncharacterized protein YukE